MTKFNKTLLAAAVAGAIALPGIAMAASLGYGSPQQITYAKDLIVNNGTTIYTPTDLVLTGAPSDNARLGTVLNNQEVRVKVTLTVGARFDQTADATTLVNGFLVGSELGGTATGTSLGGRLIGTPYYSNSGQELNFAFRAPGDGGHDAAGYALNINSMQVTQLTQGLFDADEIGAEITVQNSVGQQILAARAPIARSKWGLDVSSDLSNVNQFTTIDVSGGDGFNRRTRFSPTGQVGGASNTDVLWTAGQIVIDVASALETDGATESYVNNYSAVASQPAYNVVATAGIFIDVKGSDLTAFAGQNVFLSSNPNCSTADLNNGTLNAAGDTYSFNAPASHPLFANVTNAPPSASMVNVCFRASGTNEMSAQDLTATVRVDYRLPTQRVNPPATTVNLAPLTMNGEELTFQNVNPGQNGRAQSFLRITNNNADVCPITIDAKDDAGRLSGEVTFTLAPHASWHANSDTLENGADHFQGSFGDGTGRWYVRITAECDNIRASALNRNLDTGVVTNLTPEKGHGRTWLTPSTSL